MKQRSGLPSGPELLIAVPGLLLCAGLGVGAVLLAKAPFVADRLHVGALLLVILLGMALRALWKPPNSLSPGIDVAQKPILRWGVALLGFKLSMAELASIGLPAVGVVLVSTAAALFFGWWVAARLGLGEKLGLLLGVGSAVCGASAIVAADSVLRSDRKDVAASLGVITLLGTLGILIYPLIAAAADLTPFVYGVWDGASLHEMAQVIAAGQAHGDEALRAATVVKLARISLLAPIVLGISWWMARRSQTVGQAHVAPVPWFLIAFVIFAAVNSAGLVSKDATDWLLLLGLLLLCTGMAAVGLQTSFSDLREAGWRTVFAGAAQWVFLATLSLALTLALCG